MILAGILAFAFITSFIRAIEMKAVPFKEKGSTLDGVIVRLNLTNETADPGAVFHIAVQVVNSTTNILSLPQMQNGSKRVPLIDVELIDGSGLGIRLTPLEIVRWAGPRRSVWVKPGETNMLNVEATIPQGVESGHYHIVAMMRVGAGPVPQGNPMEIKPTDSPHRRTHFDLLSNSAEIQIR
jgi:hypothetical protein